MVPKHRQHNMTSEQPLQKKLKREHETEHLDETPVINTSAENDTPVNIQEDDSRNPNRQFCGKKSTFLASECECKKCEKIKYETVKCKNSHKSDSFIENCGNTENIFIKPATNQHLVPTDHFQGVSTVVNSSSIHVPSNSPSLLSEQISTQDDENDYELDDFQSHLINQCICGISETALRKPFEGQQINDNNGIRKATLSEWSVKKILKFLSNLHLLFDVYLTQNNEGHICSRIVTVCDTIISNENNLIEQIISLCDTRNKFVNFLAVRVLSRFIMVAKTDINNEWLETIINYLNTENIDYFKMNFSLEVVKHVVEWKDIEMRVLGDEETSETPEPSSQLIETTVNCVTIPFTDSESYDTSAIKALVLKRLESKWPELIQKVHDFLQHNMSVEIQTCSLTFLALWESIISTKSNLNVIQIEPFYTGSEMFVKLNYNLSPLICKRLLSIFNEVCCYCSTLALQDAVSEYTCELAECFLRYVRDHRLLDRLPYRRDAGLTVHSFVGTISSVQNMQSSVDKTLLQKMVLVVLKSVAIIIKKSRSDDSDSSDSSSCSDDSESHQDTRLVEESVQVLKKVHVFMKNSLDFHPETPLFKILINLFKREDDYMTELMVCALDITVGVSYRNALYPCLMNMLNPVHTFIEFLTVVSHNPVVLLNYLIDNETCFLLYLLNLLKYAKRNWLKFVDSCLGVSAPINNELDKTMSVLINLNKQINVLVSRNLFPYDITPVVTLLEECRKLYERN